MTTRTDANGETLSSEREIVLTREVAAPRTLVFEVYTDPAHVEKWWGPRGYTIRVHEMDVRPGGLWRFLMHGPDGTDYPNRVQYEEVVRPERLVFQHGSDDEPDQFHVTITFDDLGGKTRITQRMLFPTAEACSAVKAFGAVELGYQTLDRLAEHLATI